MNDLFDVVIFELETHRVDSVIGKGMKREGRYNSAETRLDTVLGRLNERYCAAIVPAGKYDKGSTLAAEDIS